MKSICKNVCVLALFVGITGCSTPSAPPPPPPAPPAPVVGGDSDAHGCKGSAGYQWSVVKNECIRLFESGIRLDAKAAGLDKTVSAFVVFKSDADDMQAELFLPSAKGSVLMGKLKKESAGTWKSDTLTLEQWKGMYTLTGKSKQVLYEGSAAK